jgi:hypothetical protein
MTILTVELIGCDGITLLVQSGPLCSAGRVRGRTGGTRLQPWQGACRGVMASVRASPEGSSSIR